jgi:isoquinoline 1-oxidoreductase beta subunit
MIPSLFTQQNNKPGALTNGESAEPAGGGGTGGLSRRSFLKTTAVAGAAGLLIGFRFTPKLSAAVDAAAVGGAGSFAPNAFLRIAPSGAVTLLAKHSEMGQGVYTTLAMCVAEELDVDMARIAVEAAPSAQAYAHTAFGMQMTGGSTSTWEAYQQMRQAGATARALLVEAAARRWQVAAATLRTENGTVLAADGRKLGYGELADEAAKLPPPTEVKLKEAAQFGLIGKKAHRVDSRAKVTGKAEFGIDVRVPGMLTAVIVRPPVFGGKVKSFDAAPAKALAGVRHVVAVTAGVAVVADNFWAAKKGAEALTVGWDDGALAALDSAQQGTEYAALLRQPGAVAKKSGDVAKAFAGAATKIEATFEFPYLAHAAMEPLNATAHVKADGTVEVWAPTQMQTVDQMAAAKVAGVTPDKVTMHTTLLGGGFGRKANPASDFVVEAVEVSKAVGAPVRVVWTREDDMRGGYYRPRTLVAAKLGLDAAGKPVSWENQIVSQSLIKGTPFEAFMFKDGLDGTQVEGLDDLAYVVPAMHTEWHMAPMGVPVLWWRSVGHTFTGFVKETLIDDAARAAKQDPIDYRISLLGEHPRQVAILKLLKEKSNWGRAPQGRFQGVAIHESFGSIVGQVAEISVGVGGAITVHKVTAVADCGQAVNPDGVRAQVMSAVVYGLSAALHGKITFRGGRVEQSNFHDYVVQRINEVPVVETHIIDSGAKMGGMGEPGTPPLAPAVSNAILAATGRRLRKLPFELS